MKRSIPLAALAAALVAAAPAAAAPDKTVTLTPDPETSQVVEKGPAVAGLNLSYFEETPATPATCAKAVQNYCYSLLVKVDGADEQFAPLGKNRTLKVVMDGFTAASDYDLRVYRSNEKGERVNFEGSPTARPTGPLHPVLPTFLGDHEEKSVSGLKKGSYVLVDVVYFLATPAEAPRITATLR